MPTIELSKRDLEGLVGKKFSAKHLEQALLFVKGEVDKVEGDRVWVDIKDTNRPDLWGVEGIARELKARLGKQKGLVKYKVKKGRVHCKIEKSVEQVRPFITCAVIRNVKITKEFLVQIIQLQEKVGMTFGRRRKECGIGLYDFDKMQPLIYYKGYKDNEIEFVPLEYKVKMSPKEVLKEHPKGKEFGHLLEKSNVFPIVIDSNKVVASMPPIINSQATGRINEKTKNIFLEVTGFNWETVNTALKVMTMAFADRGGKIETVKISFPKGKIYPKTHEFTPNFGTKKIELSLEYINKLSGMNFSLKQVIVLLARARMNAKKKGKKVVVEYSDFRQDILHPVDIVEDILISFGYNNVLPTKIEMPVFGNELSTTSYLDNVRDACVGLGLQEILSFTLTSKEKQKIKTGLIKEEFVEIANPVSANWEIFRKNIFPENLDFLNKNKNQEFPQKIFEVGKTVELNPKKETRVSEKEKLCICISDARSNYSNIKSVLDSVCNYLGLTYKIAELKHPCFESGKSAQISIGEKKGFMGELNQSTLQNFGLETKTIVLEMEV